MILGDSFLNVVTQNQDSFFDDEFSVNSKALGVKLFNLKIIHAFH